MGVRQRVFSPFLASHWSGRFWPSTTPDACGPRNEGQLPLEVVASWTTTGDAAAVRTMRRSGMASASLVGRQLLRSKIIRRGTQSSNTRSKLSREPSTWNRYRPGSSQPAVPRPDDAQVDLRAPGPPGARHGRPALAFQHERAVGAEADHEHAKGHWRGRKLRSRCLAHGRWTDGAGGEDTRRHEHNRQSRDHAVHTKKGRELPLFHCFRRSRHTSVFSLRR